MFTFLSPLSLWLGALLAVPLVIHFLGRQRLRREPFPSLLLLEEKFSKSMHRHRLKNLLLLLLRTLLILCLLLALANPALERMAGPAAGTEAAGALVHNGAYGLLPYPGAGDGEADPARREAHRSTALGKQRRLIRALDSASGVRSVPLIADGPGVLAAAARFGDYREGVERLLAAMDLRTAATAYLPVFAWADLAGARETLERALREHPGLHLALWDFAADGARLSAFAGVRAVPSARAPTVNLRAFPNPLALEAGAVKLRAWLGSRVFHEADAAEAMEVAVPLGEGARTPGRLSLVPETGSSLPGGGFGVADWHFCFPNPGRMLLAHAGSTLATLPSLGRENYFRRIVHVAAAKDIPWDGRGAEGEGAGSLRLIYLSNDRSTDAAAYGRIVEFVKRGGRLIVGVGQDSDVPLLNRFLLQPLRLGRLGAVVETPQGAPVEADARHLAGLGAFPPGAATGLARKRFAFAPDSGVDGLLRQGGEAVLAARDFHRGRVLLWTTDLDNLDWTDLGVSPLVPLLHQAFQESAGGLPENRTVASDSMISIPLPDPARGLQPEVRDPDGRPFTRFRSDGTRLRLGPFDKLGIHQAVFAGDTVAFAVNLMPRGPGAGEDWGKWNDARKAEFLESMKPFRRRLTVSPADGGGESRASMRPLWKAFFLAAILLLFAEGLIASAFAMGRKAP